MESVVFLPLLLSFLPFSFVLTPGGVAFDAVLEIGNAFLQMLPLDLRWPALVAAITGVRLERTLVVADVAGDVGAALVVEREGVLR